MAEIKQFEPQVRFVNGLQIYFKDKHSVVVSKGSTCIIFHRWFERPRGSYRNWFHFCRTLKRRNTISELGDVSAIAAKYDIDHHTVTTTIRSLPPRGIKVLPSEYIYG